MRADTGSFLSLSHDILGKGHCLRFQALGLSMTPCIPNGSFIYVRPVPADRLRPGDIIFYRSGETLVAHRLLMKEAGSGNPVLVTRGDALSWSTIERLTPDQVLGQVVAIEWRGWPKLRIDFGPGRRLSLLFARLSPFLWPVYLALSQIKRIFLASSDPDDFRS